MKTNCKTTLTFTTLLCLVQLMTAQTVGKGASMVGGVLSFSSQKVKDDDDSYTYLNIDPNVGYYFMDDFAVGLQVLYNSTSYAGETSSSFFLGPWLRYYVTNPIFIQVGATLGLDEGSGSLYGGQVGYSWFLNNHVAIEPALFFNSVDNDGDTNDSTIFGLSIGVQAFLHHEHGLPD